MKYIVPVAPIFLLLASCGGGGEPATPPITLPPNAAPVFTSPTSASIVENAVLALQAAATDANGDPLTFSLGGGADAARFSISAAGALSFAVPPSFETAADSDGDNVYQVTIVVSDGRAQTAQSVQIRVTDSREGIAVRQLTSVGRRVTAVAVTPAGGLLFGLPDGNVIQYDPATGTRTLLTNGGLSPVGEIIGIASGINYATSRTFFYTAVINGQISVYTGGQSFAGAPLFTGSAILSIPHGDFSNNIAAPIVAAADGSVYILTGDAGGVGDPRGSAQDPNSKLGKVIRLTRNPDPFAGATPQPYLIGLAANGLHNPNGAAIINGSIIFGDRGETIAGEINALRLDAAMGFFGWPSFEGNNSLIAGATPGAAPLIVVPFGNGPRNGRSIVGGNLYTGPIASLSGTYVFGDSDSSIWTTAVTTAGGGITPSSSNYERRNLDFAPATGTLNTILGIVQATDGAMYLIDSDGDVFVVEPGS